MKATLTKRVSAYLIDLIIVVILLTLIGLIYHPDTSLLNSDMDKVTLDYATGDISFNEYFTNMSNIYKEIDMTNIFQNIINVIIIMLYFIVLPFLNKGRTLGKQYMHIEVKNISNQPLNIKSLFLRNLIINGLFYLILVIICSLIVKGDYYFIVITTLAIIQLTLLFISIIMVLQRKDRKGLHDLIASTWVAASR